MEGGELQKDTPFIPPIQTKLTIGEPGDMYEQEADKTADTVVHNANDGNTLQKQNPEEEEVQAKPLAAGLTPFIQKQEAGEEEKENVQAQAEEQSEEEEVIQPQEEEESIQQQVEEEEIQAKAEGEEAEHIQAKSNKTQLPTDHFGNELKDQKGRGNKMDEGTKGQMDHAFGVNFSNVRIHEDDKANKLNKAVNAKAFTHGSDIYFKKGKYNPDSSEGKHLLAHELTHTIQQGAVDSGMHTKPTKVQRVPINYRALTWADFKGKAPLGSPNAAGVSTGLDQTWNKGFISADASWNGKEATVTIKFKKSNYKLKAIAETNQSWKKKWLTDDAAAKKKFGKSHDIEKERKLILSHEQIHFKITREMAKKYQPQIRAVFPKTYKEKGPATTEAERDAFMNKVLKKKAAELEKLVETVYNKADAEFDAVQDIYDVETGHSTIKKKQKLWKDKFSKTFKAAYKQAKAKVAAKSP